MLERGMKGYDAAFVLGLIFLILIYFLTYSLEAALTIAVLFWVISLTIFICYHFELADDYYRRVKDVTHPKGNRVTNILILLSIFLIGIIGGISGAAIGIFIFGQNGISTGLGSGLGIGLALKLYHHLILKRLK